MSVLLDVSSGSVELFASNSLKMSVLFDISSGKLCSIVCQKLSEIIIVAWYLEKGFVLFWSNSLKVTPTMFDINSKNVFTLFGSDSMKVRENFWYELWKVFNLN